MDMLVIWSLVLYQYYIPFRHQTIPFGGCIMIIIIIIIIYYLLYCSCIIIWQNNKLAVVKKKLKQSNHELIKKNVAKEKARVGYFIYYFL